MSDHETAGANQKSARKMQGRFAKSDYRYWLKRVKVDESANVYVQISHLGKRSRFTFKTANKEVAAKKIPFLYFDIVAKGWEEALAIHKPKGAKKQTPLSTIGALISEIKAASGIKPGTLTIYAQNLRQLSAGIADVKEDAVLDKHGKPKRDRQKRIVTKSRFDYRSGGRDLWQAKVDALPLNILTAEAIQRWRIAYVNKSLQTPDVRKRAENSAASIIRNARANFSEKALEFAKKNLLLPNPLPFFGVKLPKKQRTKYQSKIDAPQLIALASEELNGPCFQIFSLAMLCGLRKREMDLLMWKQIDFNTSQIRIERTEWFEPKSEDSIAMVDVEPQLLALLRGWKANATSKFVIESNRPPRHTFSRVNYRCQPIFEKLYTWLRSKGITANKPMHELRKELGAILASDQGIFAAQSVLRHAQISTTADYYTDKKRTITAGLGKLLERNIKTIPFVKNSSMNDAANNGSTTHPKTAINQAI